MSKYKEHCDCCRCREAREARECVRNRCNCRECRDERERLAAEFKEDIFRRIWNRSSYYDRLGYIRSKYGLEE